jgi:hypothetical protein
MVLSLACVDKAGFSLALATPQVTAVAGGTATVTVNLTRDTNYTNAVTLSLANPPSGITGSGSVAGSSTSGTLTLNVAASVNPGTYSLTVSGTDGSLTRTAGLSLTVTPSGASCVWTFDASAPPALVAFRDGGGAWAAVAGDGGVYRFNLTAETGSVAYVLEDGAGSSNLVLTCGTRAQLAAKDLRSAAGDGLTVSGTYAGLPDASAAVLSLGYYEDGPLAQATVQGTGGTSGAWTMDYVDKGTWDLLGVRFGADQAPDALVLHRGLSVTGAGSLGTLGSIDFASEGQPLAAHALTVNNLDLGAADLVKVWQSFETANATAMLGLEPLYGVGTVPIYHLPAGVPATDDRYTYAVQVGPDDGTGFVDAANNRTLWTYGTAAEDVAVEAPRDMAASTLTVAATAPYPRLRLQWSFDATYNKGVSVQLVQGSACTWTLDISPEFMGTSVDFTLPDLSALAGWKPSWAFTAGSPVTMALAGWGQNWTSWPAPAGAWSSKAIRTVTVTP